MRVVHAIRSGNFAGVERHVLSLAITQRQRGDEVTVIGGDASRMQAPLAEAGARFTPATTTFDVVHALARLRSWGPDVINAHMTAAETAAVITGLAPGAAPIVATRHFATHRGSRPAIRAILRLGARRLAAQIAVSNFVAEHIDGPSTVVHSGVPNADASLTDRRERRVLVAARLDREKHLEVALEAFARSKLAADGWSLEFAGSGDQLNTLQEHTESLGIDRSTTFLGRRSDISELMGKAALLLAPSAREPYGLAVLEAMASGLPVVASASGGHLETVGSASDAAMFPAGDVDAAAQLLRELAAAESRRVAYGAALRAIQRERFTLEAQAEATDAVYRSVL